MIQIRWIPPPSVEEPHEPHTPITFVITEAAVACIVSLPDDCTAHIRERRSGGRCTAAEGCWVDGNGGRGADVGGVAPPLRAVG